MDIRVMFASIMKSKIDKVIEEETYFTINKEFKKEIFEELIKLLRKDLEWKENNEF